MNYGWNHARQNCLGFKRQFHETDTTRRTYAKLDLQSVFELLDRAPPFVQSMKIRLRGDMNREHWHLVASLHRGGKETSRRPPDEQLHFDIRFEFGTYHIRCRERSDGTVYVFDITL
jgi:hypothetical protein